MSASPLSSLTLVVETEPRPATLNMALDEALLETTRVPVLRFYRWERPAISFGCFQAWGEVATRFPGREMVRRPTGGGAVEHGDPGETATYALVVPRAGGELAGLGDRPAVAFCRVHRALANALTSHAVAVALHEEESAASLGGACFHDRPVPGDLILVDDGRKVAGAAQRRTRTGLLHQGSIRLPGGLDVARLAADFALTLAGETLRQAEVAPETRALGEELARTKYGQRAWTERR